MTDYIKHQEKLGVNPPRGLSPMYTKYTPKTFTFFSVLQQVYRR